MKKRNIVFVTLIFLIIFMLSACSPDNNLTGLWQNKESGINLLLYSKDKKTDIRKCTLGLLNEKYDGTYEVKKNKLTVYFEKDVFEDSSISYIYELDGDTLTLITDETEIVLERVSVK